MKVALVHDYLTEYGGAERVLELLKEMYPQAPVYTSLYNQAKMPQSFQEWDIRTSFLQRLPFHFRLQKPFTYLMPWVFELMDLRGYDLVISSTSCAAHGLVLPTDIKHIVYCHTPPKFAWGLANSNPRKGLRMFLKPFDLFFRKWDFAAAQRADVYIANSKEVRDRVKRFYERDSVVIYPPIIDVIPAKAGIFDSVNATLTMDSHFRGNEKQKYYLVVSRLEKLKNLDLIIKACMRQNRKLKIAGKGTQEKYLKSIADDSVEFLGFVPDEQLPNLYRNATALILAAESEDFGMTPVEAHLYGCPVLAYYGGGYKETVIEGVNGHFFNELSVDILENGLHEIEEMEFDSNAIQKTAERFSKEAFIRGITDVVDQVMKS